MKPLNWGELTRQQIKARQGFGWSIQGIEKQNKVITKIVYRFLIVKDQQLLLTSNGTLITQKRFKI